MVRNTKNGRSLVDKATFCCQRYTSRATLLSFYLHTCGLIKALMWEANYECIFVNLLHPEMNDN